MTYMVFDVQRSFSIALDEAGLTVSAAATDSSGTTRTGKIVIGNGHERRDSRLVVARWRFIREVRCTAGRFFDDPDDAAASVA